LRYRIINNNPNWSTGYNRETRPAAVAAAQVINSTYTDSQGDMVSLEMRIVGDPTLIKQDDWYYGPDPTAEGDYNKWNSMSQSDFIATYGHARTDTGEVVVRVNVNTVYDLDADVPGLNQGLMFPDPSLGTASLFSGQYKISTVKSEFKNGVFEQTLNLYRYVNDSINAAFRQSQNNQREITPTTPSAITPSTGGTVGQVQSNQTSVNGTTARQ